MRLIPRSESNLAHRRRMRKVLDCFPLLSGLTETISVTSQSATPCASSAARVRDSNSLSMKGTRIEMVTVRSSFDIGRV